MAMENVHEREVIPFDFEILGKKNRKTYYNNFFQDKYIQSVCFDKRNMRYLVGFSYIGSSELSEIIWTPDLTFDHIERTFTIPAGHCNDMVYCNDQHRVYIARGDKNIAVLNPDTMSIEKLIPVDVYVWSIDRFRNGDFFVHDGNGSFRYNSTFTNKTTLSTDDTLRIAKELNVQYSERQKCYKAYWQGGFVLDDTPYMIYTEWKDSEIGFKACAFVSPNEIYRCPTELEVEAGCIINGKLQLVYGNTFIGGASWDMNELKMKTVYGTVKNIEIPINTNIDLDFSKYVPAGYELVSANVSFKKEKYWRTLPFCNDEGKCIIKVLKTANNKITIRSNEKFNTSFQITGFCRKTEE